MKRSPLSPRARRATLAAAILAAGVLGAGTLVATAPRPEARPPEERAWHVSVATVRPGREAPRLAVHGRVEAATATDLAARVAAPVAEVLVREGDRVRAGDVLLRLDDADAALVLARREADVREARAALASVRSELALAERLARERGSVAALADEKLERYRRLFEQRMVARTLLDEVEREGRLAHIAHEEERARVDDGPHRVARQEAILARAEAEAAQARLDVARTGVRAPFDGPVVAVHVGRGDQVDVGTPLLRLVDDASVEVRAPVPADQAARIRRHLAAGGRLVAEGRLGERRLELPLTRLAGNQRDGRTVIDAFFALPDAAPEPGRVLELQLALPPEDDVVALPVTAVYENDRLYRVTEGRLEAVPAEIVGEVEEGAAYRLLVRAPALRRGDRVVTTQLPRAMTGLRVAPVGDEARGGEPAGVAAHEALARETRPDSPTPGPPS
ncbi:MAG: HlyD family efflux transporter periplasmic adaptor subunit [Pseudomonadales bacterium]|jgi:multidrug efflux pump subunit AcrA (membrane-fusion protein)|nr:HlyD family efflux transporter periplasmic adaptor subunit [Pseudomonadales bacterium]